MNFLVPWRARYWVPVVVLVALLGAATGWFLVEPRPCYTLAEPDTFTIVLIPTSKVEEVRESGISVLELVRAHYTAASDHNNNAVAVPR